MSDSVSHRILVVDDKPNMVSLLKKVLRADAQVVGAERGRDAIKKLEEQPYSVVLCDLKMPDIDGLEVLRASKRLQPNAEFILMTAYASVATAVEALRLGAYDYLAKPFEPEAARAIVLRALSRASAVVPLDLDLAASGNEVLPGVIARSESMLELGDLVRRIAASDASVLVLGETGTGKERVSRAIHTLSRRKSKRFVPVNCAAIPGELLESELFGYAKGAFTGSSTDRAGLFSEAHEGTLFLDEIGDMRLSLQAKLTRVLDDHRIRRVGESKERSVDVRLVAATHRDIAQMVEAGSFREDLWYRLNVATIWIPPLRERRDDIELLAFRFFKDRTTSTDRSLRGFSSESLDVINAYDWPGNVRQLRSAVERATIVAKGDLITPADLPSEVTGRPSAVSAPPNLHDLSWQEVVDWSRDKIAAHYLRALLRKHAGRVVDAAAQANVERESFYRLLRRHGVSASDYKKR